MDNEFGYVTVSEAAERLGIAPKSVRERLAAGTLPGRKLGSQTWLIPRTALAEAPGNSRGQKLPRAAAG